MPAHDRSEAPLREIAARRSSRRCARRGEAFLLLDVREPDEFAKARIEGAQLVPLGELEARAGRARGVARRHASSCTATSGGAQRAGPARCSRERGLPRRRGTWRAASRPGRSRSTRRCRATKRARGAMEAPAWRRRRSRIRSSGATWSSATPRPSASLRARRGRTSREGRALEAIAFLRKAGAQRAPRARCARRRSPTGDAFLVREVARALRRRVAAPTRGARSAQAAASGRQGALCGGGAPPGRTRGGTSDDAPELRRARARQGGRGGQLEQVPRHAPGHRDRPHGRRASPATTSA